MANSGRSCINCSGIWASRHTREIAQALAERIRSGWAASARRPECGAGRIHGAGAGARDLQPISMPSSAESGVDDMTRGFHDGRLVERERCDYLRPTVRSTVTRPTWRQSKKEYMFPFVTVVQCPQDKMLGSIGTTLVATALTEDESFKQSSAGCEEHRSPERRSDSHDQAQLAPAARRQHRRLPVPAARVPGGVLV